MTELTLLESIVELLRELNKSKSVNLVNYH
jgi:hypothetical protein